MARIETLRLVDDLTGDPGDETVDFAVDGSRYEIDLTSANAAKLRDALATYIRGARRSTAAGPLRRRRGPGTSSSLSTERRQHNNAIRAWARQRGYTIGDRGRIPDEIVDAYERDAGRAGGAPSPRSANSTDAQFQTAAG